MREEGDVFLCESANPSPEREELTLIAGGITVEEASTLVFKKFDTFVNSDKFIHNGYSRFYIIKVSNHLIAVFIFF